MRPISIAFAAALMLGGMSTAYAQDGPGKDKERPAQAQQQGQSGGADRGQAETKSDRGGGAEKSEGRADRSNGESRSGDNRSAERGSGNEAQGERRGRDAEGQGGPRQAQDEKGSPANNERASKRDDGDTSSRKGQAESGKSQRDEDRKAADRSGQDKEKRAQSRDDADKRAATQKDDDAKRAESRDRQDRGDDAKRAESKDRQDKDDTAKRAEGKDGDRKAARVNLQGEKKDKVRSAFSERAGNVRERTNVDIDISVGRALPGDWDYYPLPADVIAIVPEYRGYEYVYVDDRYVIVEPATHEVVTVIDVSGNRTQASTAGGSGCPSNLRLTSSDRDYLLKSVQMRNEVDVSGVSIGWRVPESVELQAFPDTVTRRISGLGSCRYFVVDDRIAIVDPEDHNVVVLVQD